MAKRQDSPHTDAIPQYFSAEIRRATAIPFSQLHKENILQLLEAQGADTSNIYLITTHKRLRFDTERVSINSIGQLKLHIKVGSGPSTRAFVPIWAIEPFRQLESEMSFMMREQFKKMSVVQERTTSKEICIRIEMADNSRKELLIPIDSIWHYFDLDFKSPPEIVYVGQSFDILQRLQKHEKVNQAASELGDDEDIRLIFLHFQIMSRIDPKMKTPNPLLNLRDPNSQEFKDIISLIEQMLIKFYRPRYNRQNVDTEISASAHVKRLISKTNLRYLSLGVGMYGHSWQFWSELQEVKQEFVSYDLLHPEKGFHEGFYFI